MIPVRFFLIGKKMSREFVILFLLSVFFATMLFISLRHLIHVRWSNKFLRDKIDTIGIKITMQQKRLTALENSLILAQDLGKLLDISHGFNMNFTKVNKVITLQEIFKSRR